MKDFWRAIKIAKALLNYSPILVLIADMIFVMESGKIAEMGNYQEFIDKGNGIYANLYEIQLGGYLT